MTFKEPSKLSIYLARCKLNNAKKDVFINYFLSTCYFLYFSDKLINICFIMHITKYENECFMWWIHIIANGIILSLDFNDNIKK